MSLGGIQALIKQFDSENASNAEKRRIVDTSADKVLATGLVSNAPGNNQTVLLAYANERRKEELTNLQMMLDMADELQLSVTERTEISQKIRTF